MIFVYWNKYGDICVKETDGRTGKPEIYANPDTLFWDCFYPNKLFTEVLLKIEPKLKEQQLFIIDNRDPDILNYSLYDMPELNDFLYVNRKQLTVLRLYVPEKEIMYLIQWYRDNRNNEPFQ